MKVLGVIPARGGSKGVIDKNIRDLKGIPLLEWTIRASIISNLTKVILSTDSEKIAFIGKSCGVSVPFVRPDNLASDSAKSIDVLLHALVETEKHDDIIYDAVMLLQPTTPFRTKEDINKCLALMEARKCDSVISVEDVEAFHPARMKYIRDGLLVDPDFCESIENQPRQELESMYIRNGAIYLTKRKIIKQKSFKGSSSLPYIMPKNRSVNIDSETDFQLAEWLAEKNEYICT